MKNIDISSRSLAKYILIRFRLHKLLSLAGLASNLITIACNSAPFTNGGFELPKLATGAMDQAPTSIPGWDLSKGEAALSAGNAWGAYPVEGRQHLAIGINDSSHGNTVSQTFDTDQGGVYTITFQAGWSGNPGTNPGKSMRAIVYSAAKEQLASLDATLATAKGYGPISSFTFAATTDTTTLTFLDTSSTAYQSNLLLDNVSVSKTAQIIQQPKDQQVPLGGKAVFSIEITGSEVSYQWFFNDVAIPNENAKDLVLDAVRLRDAGQYSVEIKISNGGVTIHSQEAKLLVSDFAVEIFTAVEIKFPSQINKKYQIQFLTEIDGPWSSFGDPIDGTGQFIYKLISTRDIDAKFFHVVELKN